jgi:DHA1 family tetracycline resistance protein-like MFS transporter
VGFLGCLGHVVLPSTFVLYASYRYGWDERMLGLCLAGVGLCFMVVQAALVRPIVSRLGERKTLLLGYAFGVAGFAVYGLASTSTLFWLGIPLMSMWGISGPAAQGLMTRHVKPTDQGQLQGATSSLQGMAELVGPFLFTMTFAAFIHDARWHLPGAPFLLASLLLGAALLVAWRVTRASGASPAPQGWSEPPVPVADVSEG